MKYKILYLPTGEYLKRALDFMDNKDREKPYILDTEEKAELLIATLCRVTKPKHPGFMSYNELIFPSIRAHFHLVKVDE